MKDATGVCIKTSSKFLMIGIPFLNVKNVADDISGIDMITKIRSAEDAHQWLMEVDDELIDTLLPHAIEGTKADIASAESRGEDISGRLDALAVFERNLYIRSRKGKNINHWPDG